MERQQAGASPKPESIERFAGPHRFLSNFYPAPLVWEGRYWPTAEHAYQAAKCHRSDELWRIQGGVEPRCGQAFRKEDRASRRLG